MENRYEPLKDLGSGNFGVARLVRDKKTNELVAVKYIERGKKVNNSTVGFNAVKYLNDGGIESFGSDSLSADGISLVIVSD